ncbi:ATP-binding cassette domain-containing protein [Roseateles depolymerans]|uniref:ABC-transporter n=1 Tax=Roseateles depolymerans TaxID=76731 RepID=A0A0U3E038_9BURK|nr:ATP-binding cassette domain-containing protein [Roseateles depolymerans]ALV06501.1 ABC-transporter [Roseateles depolymerans]REG19476.1 response regulator receiver protein [Roseateles depolymerans]
MESSPPRPTTARVVSGLWSALWQWRWRVLVALVLLVASKLAAVGVPGLLKAIVDHLTPAPVPGASAAQGLAIGLTLPVWLLIGYALLRYASTLFTELRDLVFARVGKQVVSGFSERAFAHLLAMSPRFHAQRNTGSLVREVERGTHGMGYLLGAGVFTVVPTAVEFAAVLVVLLQYGVGFVVIIAGSMALYAIWTGWMTRARVEKQRVMNAFDSRAHGLLVDTLLNYDAVKTHGREQAERARYGSVLSEWVEGSVSSQKTLSALHLGQAAIIAAGVAGVMLMAGQDTVQGRMSIGDLVLVNAYLIQVFLPLNTLGFVFRETRDALLNTEALFALLDRPPDIQDAPDAAPLAPGDTTVRFERIDFAYDPQRQILHDLSLEIPHGKTFAVVGSSGSGKSTLARLLMRLWDPDRGQVRIGTQDLREVSQQSLRQVIGVVPQDPVLFNDTIAYNIAYGKPDATRDELVAAAKAAQADDFIRMLPEQYDTRVGERGARLSGGEKQRIAIARAFLKNPPIIVLDEATSALDTRAERAIQGALENVAKDRTSLIIAHRLSTIVGADEIIVMDRGRIAERGRHDELLAHPGLYAQLWELQRQQQQAETLERRLAQHPVNLAGLLVLSLDSLREQLAATATELYTDIDLDVASVIGDAAHMARIVQLMCQLALHGAAGGRMEARVERGMRASSLTIGYHGRLALEALGPPDTLELRTLVAGSNGHLSMLMDPFVGVQQYQLDFPLPALAPPPLPTAAVQEVVPSETLSADERAALDEHPLSGLHVMCVDDDEDALSSLGHLLEHDGARTERISSGHEALSRLHARATVDWPDVLVCDIALGPEDGHAVVRSIRTLEAQREVPLDQRLPAVALTGLAQPEDRLRALVAGFQRHLAKPVNPDELVRALHQLARVHA